MGMGVRFLLECLTSVEEIWCLQSLTRELNFGVELDARFRARCWMWEWGLDSC